MSASSNILYFSRNSKIPRALVSSREVLIEKFPSLYCVFSTIIPDKHPNQTSSPRCVGSLVGTRYVDDFLEEHWDYQQIERSFVADKSLIIDLPDEFEPVLEQLVIAIPEVETCIEPGLLERVVCFRWTCYLPGESVATRIHVASRHLPDIMFGVPVKPENGWISLVMISGNTVAVGGFIASESLIRTTDKALFRLRDESNRTLQSDDANNPRNETQSFSNLVAECHIDSKFFYVSFTNNDY